MNKYDFVVTTTLTDRVTVIAEDEDEAKRKIIDLMQSDFIPSDLAFKTPSKNAELKQVVENINLIYPDKYSALNVCESLVASVDATITSAYRFIHAKNLQQAALLTSKAEHLAAEARQAQKDLALYISYPCCGTEDEQMAVERVDDLEIHLEDLIKKLKEAKEAKS